MMRKSISAVLFAFVTLVLWGCGAPEEASTDPDVAEEAAAALGTTDFLKTSGTLIKKNNGTGAAVNLRGTNLGGWLIQEPWMSPLSVTDEWTMRETLTNRFGEATKESLINGYLDAWLTTADLDNIKNMGMNFVRVPILYLSLMDKYGNWKADPWSRLDWLVSNASARGIYVLLDLHGTFGAQNTFDNSGEANSNPQLWSNTTYQDRTVTLWQGIANHFKGNPAVAGYDLLNEPDRVGRDQLNNLYNRLYGAIRAIDPDHIIYMEAAWDWNQLYPPSHFGWTNVVYEMHYYAMATGQASDWNAQNALIDGAIQGIRDHQSQWNVPVYAGEFCVFAFNDLWEKFLGGLNSVNASWTNWTYKVSSNYGNWGFYTNNTNAVPNINSDDAATIASKWSRFGTSNFSPNTTFQNLVKKYTGAPSPVPSGYASLKSMANQKVVCADNSGTSPLVANRDSAGDWELFRIVTNSDGTISLQSKVNNLYVSADLNQSSRLIARSASIQGWEKFRLVDLGNGTVALQAMANNLYVTTDLDHGAGLVATRAAVGGAWEAFTVTAQ